MEKNIPIHLQEIIFGSSDPKTSKLISKLEKEGKVRKISPRLYSGNLIDGADIIVRRNIFTILGHLYPGSVLSHRSALEFKPTATGQLFVTYTYNKKISLPGITIRFLEGYAPIEGDNKLAGELFVSQRERALLENLQVSRKLGPDSKTLTLPEIEEKLEQIVRVNGEDELNKTRDLAREISIKLDLKAEFEKLDKMISALLSTQTSKILKSPLALARAFGKPYDSSRYELFDMLYQHLSQHEFKYFQDENVEIQAYRNFAFFESYFSNYIEGTEFELDDAKKIIETQIPLAARNADSHDILGTYNLVSNKQEMSIVPDTAEELLHILKYRHQVLLSARKDKNPGEFKDKNNFAGQTSFVDFKLVEGTLIKSFDYYGALKHPFAKAVYIMFVISEVHPFLDGNGRIARLMMNAELTQANQSKIIIPTVYREDYILAIRKLTRQRSPDAYVRMLSKIREYSTNIKGATMEKMQKILETSNAFYEPNEGKLKLIQGTI
ncbi:MAG: Fic family protein [Flavobacteriia bacterium]|nr:Fic family protein [Flavobacteriia bacterium]